MIALKKTASRTSSSAGGLIRSPLLSGYPCVDFFHQQQSYLYGKAAIVKTNTVVFSLAASIHYFRIHPSQWYAPCLRGSFWLPACARL